MKTSIAALIAILALIPASVFAQTPSPDPQTVPLWEKGAPALWAMLPKIVPRSPSSEPREPAAHP